VPLDHYVSQVHLRNWYSPQLGELLCACRKVDFKHFPARSEDICRIEGGNTNPFLAEPRGIEEFIKAVERPYYQTLAKIRDDKIDDDAVYCVAGFIAYLRICSPAGMRINVRPVEEMVKSVGIALAKAGRLPPPPASLGGKSAVDLLESGAVAPQVDPQYPQAIGVVNYGRTVTTIGNGNWEFLLNFHERDPYFTSDYPIAIEPQSGMAPIVNVVPLAPDLAVRVVLDRKRGDADTKFSNLTYIRRGQKRQAVLDVNRRLVRCAETLVFYRDNYEWVDRFIDKNRRYRIEPITEMHTVAGRRLPFYSQRIQELDVSK
jgi:Protein of unknown function (DUF4238)